MKKILFVITTIMIMSACTTRPTTSGEEKDYSEALFTLGEISTVELEMPEETWQKIIKKASDKLYYDCSVTINGERFDRVAIRTKGASISWIIKVAAEQQYLGCHTDEGRHCENCKLCQVMSVLPIGK